MEGGTIETLLQQLLTRLASLEEQLSRLTRQMKESTESIDKLRKKL